MAWLDGFQAKFDQGYSWLLLIVTFIVSAIICAFCCIKKENIVAEWSYEPMVEIPEHMREQPVIRDTFATLRGLYYDQRLPNLKDYLKSPDPNMPYKAKMLASGFAFAHFLQHFCIAFFCPKLIAVSFIFSVSWEIFESVFNMHCTLDILWNLLGCLTGLLFRWIFCPICPISESRTFTV